MYKFQCDDFGPIEDIENINFTLEEPEIEDILDAIIGPDTDCTPSEDLEDYRPALERYYQIDNNLPDDGIIDDDIQAELKQISEIMAKHAQLAVSRIHATRMIARGNMGDISLAENDGLLDDNTWAYSPNEDDTNTNEYDDTNEEISDIPREEEPCALLDNSCALLDNSDDLDSESTRIAKSKLKQYDDMIENFNKN